MHSYHGELVLAFDIVQFSSGVGLQGGLICCLVKGAKLCGCLFSVLVPVHKKYRGGRVVMKYSKVRPRIE